MADLSEQILAVVSRRTYQPLKPKALARKLGVSTPQYPEFKRAIRSFELAETLVNSSQELEATANALHTLAIMCPVTGGRYLTPLDG